MPCEALRIVSPCPSSLKISSRFSSLSFFPADGMCNDHACSWKQPDSKRLANRANTSSPVLSSFPCRAATAHRTIRKAVRVSTETVPEHRNIPLFFGIVTFAQIPDRRDASSPRTEDVLTERGATKTLLSNCTAQSSSLHCHHLHVARSDQCQGFKRFPLAEHRCP